MQYSKQAMLTYLTYKLKINNKSQYSQSIFVSSPSSLDDPFSSNKCASFLQEEDLTNQKII